MRVSPERFEQLAFDAADEVLARLPADLRAEAETIFLEVADEPGPEQRGPDWRGLLGLYEGVPLVERHVDAEPLAPDRITLFRLPLQAMARTEAELRHHLRQTLIHELGHFFGLSEDELEARGWA